MSEDKRFCLVAADGTEMPTALVNGEYRFGKTKHEPAATLEVFASGIISHGKTGRFVTPEGRNTIGLGRRKAVGYRLNPQIALRIGVPARG